MRGWLQKKTLHIIRHLLQMIHEALICNYLQIQHFL